VLSGAHYLQALHVVAQSDLIAVIPERLIRAYAGALNLQLLPVPLDVGTFEEFLLHPALGHADPGCLWLRGLFVEIAKSLGPLPELRVPKVQGRARRAGLSPVEGTKNGFRLAAHHQR
jgi:hypothetical protein